MNGRRRSIALLALGAALAASGARGQEKPPSPAAESAALPPEAQHVLGSLLGTWDLSGTQSTAGQSAVKLSGTSENTWVVHNRFLQCATTTSAGDATIEGLTTYGYDARTREYFATSVSTAGVPYLVLHGPYYDENRTLVLRSDASPATRQVKRRYMIHFEGNDRYTVEIFLEPIGGLPQKVVDAAYTRR